MGRFNNRKRKKDDPRPVAFRLFIYEEAAGQLYDTKLGARASEPLVRKATKLAAESGKTYVVAHMVGRVDPPKIIVPGGLSLS